MVPAARASQLAVLALVGGCSIDFDSYYRPPPDGAAPPADVVATVDRVTPGTDLGQPGADVVAPPTDLGQPPTDNPVVPTDNPVVPTDNPVVPTDNGVVPTECRAPYLVAVAENLDNNSARLLRWSFATDARCADLPLDIPHPRAVGVAFDNITDLIGPSLIVANEDAVHVVDIATGFSIRNVAAPGQPRSIWDMVSNGQGSFAVAYTFTGGSLPGTVGDVRVFDHRGGNLRQVQTWQRNTQFGISVLWMTGYPGNQGQYSQIRPAPAGSLNAAFAAFPGSTGMHSLTMPAFIPERPNVVSGTFYRSADRRGHFALAMSGGASMPTVFIGESSVASSSVTNTTVPTNRCATLTSCPAITRAIAFPDESMVGAAICEVTGTEYTVERFGGPGSGCRMLDTTGLPGRWRINDLAVVPR